MSEELPFRELITRVRGGDAEAAAELVRRYEPAIRRIVRLRLRDRRLTRRFDSVDVCQSVLASFFVRAALGQFELDQPEQLLKLLAVMARNKFTNQVRKERAECRDHRRTEDGGAETWEVPATDPSPSRYVAARDLLEEARLRLSPEDRRLLDLRAQGREWAEIAAELGGSAEALRKQFTRATARVARALGLEEGADE